MPPHPQRPACSELRKPDTPGALGWSQASATHLLHQHFLTAHLTFTPDAPGSAGCLHWAVNTVPGVSGLIVVRLVERDVLLRSGSEALAFTEGVGQSSLPRTWLPAPLRLVPP